MSRWPNRDEEPEAEAEPEPTPDPEPEPTPDPVPALLAEVARLKAENAELRAHLRREMPGATW
jgi:hypothetical protein